MPLLSKHHSTIGHNHTLIRAKHDDGTVTARVIRLHISLVDDERMAFEWAENARHFDPFDPKTNKFMGRPVR